MIEVDRVERRLADDGAFARRKFADDPLIDRPFPLRDRGDFENLFHLSLSQITARLTERRCGVDVARSRSVVHRAARRYERIEGLVWHDVDGRAIQRAG